MSPAGTGGVPLPLEPLPRAAHHRGPGDTGPAQYLVRGAPLHHRDAVAAVLSCQGTEPRGQVVVLRYRRVTDRGGPRRRTAGLPDDGSRAVTELRGAAHDDQLGAGPGDPFQFGPVESPQAQEPVVVERQNGPLIVESAPVRAPSPCDDPHQAP